MSSDVFSTPKQILITEWKEFTPTWKGTTSDPSPSGSASVNAFWRRVGSNMEINLYFTNGGAAGTAGSGNYYLLIPESKTIDEDLVNNTSGASVAIGGSATISYSGATLAIGRPLFKQATPTGIFVQFFTNTLTLRTWSNSNGSFGAALIVSIQASVPIVGWTA